MELQNWCHICMRIGYEGIKQFKQTEFSLCEHCRGYIKDLGIDVE